MLPRHSLLRESYHIARPFFHADSPALRYCTLQPALPGFDGGFQYRPSDSKVAIAWVLVDGSVSPPVPDGGGVVVPGSVVVGGGVLPATGVKTSLSTRAIAPPLARPMSRMGSLVSRFTPLTVKVATLSLRG